MTQDKLQLCASRTCTVLDQGSFLVGQPPSQVFPKACAVVGPWSTNRRLCPRHQSTATFWWAASTVFTVVAPHFLHRDGRVIVLNILSYRHWYLWFIVEFDIIPDLKVYCFWLWIALRNVGTMWSPTGEVADYTTSTKFNYMNWTIIRTTSYIIGSRGMELWWRSSLGHYILCFLSFFYLNIYSKYNNKYNNITVHESIQTILYILCMSHHSILHALHFKGAHSYRIIHTESLHWKWFRTAHFAWIG